MTVEYDRLEVTARAEEGRATMHFCCLVLIDNDGNVEEQVETLLAPYCEEIAGQYNEECGHWDWYSIGGRYTGWLSDYDPSVDIRNIEPCDLCGATGMRNDELGLSARTVDPAYTCNGCGGKGERVKWPTEWVKVDGDIQPAHVAYDREAIPYALVTPYGKWWATERYDGKNYIGTPDWKGVVMAYLGAHDGRVVVVDCHT